MNTVYLLSFLLLSILAYAIFQLTKKSEVEKEIEALTQQDEAYLLAELSSVNITVWLCFVGGLLLTANYAITYFSGSELKHILDWGLYQWSGAFIGLVVTVSITAVQKVLYASPTHHKAGLLVTTLILTFVIFSEIGSPMEKEEMKVQEKSQNSATYQAVVGAIGSTGNHASAYSQPLAEAQAKKANHEFELGRCDRHKAKGQKRVQQCETYEQKKIAHYQAQIESYQASMNAESQNNQSGKLALIQQAKALEHNTDNHSGLIKFVKEALATTYLAAMMLASLILVVAFEAGFHFAGSRAGILKAALIKIGNQDILYTTEAKRLKKAQKFKEQADYLRRQEPPKRNESPFPKYNVDFKPATAFSEVGFKPAPKSQTENQDPGQNETLGTHEEQLNLFDTTNKNTPVSSSPSEKMERKSTLPETPLPDLAGKVQGNLTGKVKTGGPVGKVDPLELVVLSGADFDKLYHFVSGKVRQKEVMPSVPALKKCVHGYVKKEEGLKASVISLPECGYLAVQVRDKMLEEGIIKDNPNYKNGLPKYVVT